MKKYSCLKSTANSFDIDKWDRDDIPEGPLSGDEVLPQIRERLQSLTNRVSDRIKGEGSLDPDGFFKEPAPIWDLNMIYKELRDILRHLKEGQ